MIRPIHPQTGEEIADLAAFLFRDHREIAGRPWVMVNMVNSIDGATTVQGGATGLTDSDDQALFHAFRAVADVILVGASTVRAEDYGPPTLNDANLAARRAAGWDDGPRLAVISRSLDFDPDSRLFSNPERRPLLLTCATAPTERIALLSAGADIVVAGEDSVDLGRALPMLGDRGHRVALCEGGPTLNGHLVDADLIDEINLSTSPKVVAGQSARIVRSPDPVVDPLVYLLDRMLMGDRTVFARWLRDRGNSVITGQR
jgi:riboflavin-specific deaminase-like protein